MVGRSRAKPKGTPEWDAPRVTLKASLNVAKEAAAVAKEAEAELARAKVQLEKARRRKAKAAQVFQGTNANGSIFPAAAGGSHSHTRDPAQLQLVARELTVAMMDAPEPTSSLYEFRSLVRATQRDFELALEDASQASHLQPGSASALLRQGRALAGMGRMHEAELSFLRGLDRSPHHPSLTGGFKDMLGPMQRGRFYHHRPKRRVEKVLDTLDTAKAQPPSAPRRLAVAAKREGTWLITWLPPANDGGDEIYEYEIQLSHEALSAPSGWRVEKTTRGAVHRAELDVGAYRLLPGTPVRVRVAARSPAGVGLYATVVDATDASGPPQLVASPPPEKWKSIDISEVLKGLQKEHGLDPVETFDATYAVWAAHVLPLKVSFRYCALLGSNPDPTKMAYDQFFTFMREIGALSTEVTTSLLGRLFIRSNSNRVDGDDSTARPDSLLEHDEFVAAVTRVAHHRVEGVVALDEQVSRFLARYVAPFVERLLDEDDFKKVIDGRAVQHVLRTHQAPLAAIFGSFARSGRMNLEQWQAMIKDGNLLDKFFTSRESVLIFVRVNLKDDLYRGDSDFDAEMTVGLPEFLRLVARLVREVQRSRGAETVETFASTLESFLSLRLVPKFRAVLKPRGVTVPVVTAEDEEGKGESESESDEGGDGKQTEAGDGAARK